MRPSLYYAIVLLLVLLSPHAHRASIMKQEDPNTVSSLLKLHLREHPFLSHQSITALDTAMQNDKVNTMQL